MKKTQLISLLMYIKKTFVSFASIVVFVALGIAIFLGIKWNEPALSNTVNNYLDAHSFHDFMLVFPYGFTADDVAAAQSLDGVSAAEGGYSAYGTTFLGGESYTLVAQSLTERIDTATVIEGEMPSAPNEVGIEKLFADAAGIKIGDTLSLTESGKNYLNASEFVVTAVVEHPSYFRTENLVTRGLCNIGDGTVDYYVLMQPSAFNTETFENCYSQLLIRGAGLDALDTLGEEYATASAALCERIKTLAQERAALRCDSITGDANEKIADAEKKLSDAQDELSSGKTELSDGEKKLADAKAEIADGEKQIADAQVELADGKKEYEVNRSKLADAQAEIADAEKKLSDAEKELEAKKLEFADGQQKIADAQVEIADGEKKLADAEKELEAKKLEFADGKQKIADAEAEIADGEKKLADAEKTLEEKKLEFKDGQQKLADARAEIADGEKKIAQAEIELHVKKLEFEDGKQKLADARATLASSQSEFDSNERLLNEKWAEYNTKYQEYLDGKDELAAGEKTLREALTANGYPEDFDEAEVQLLKDKASCTELLATLTEIEDILNSAKTELENGGDLTNVDRARVAALLRSVTAKADSILDAYIADPSSQTAGMTRFINTLLTRFGLSNDVEGAKKLKTVIDNINLLLDAYEANPDAELPEEITQALKMISGLDTSSTAVTALVNTLLSAVGDAKGETESSLADINEALDGIAEYRSGVEKLASAKASLDEAYTALTDNNAKLAEARTKLENGKAELSAKTAELNEAETKLISAESELDSKKLELSDAKKTVADNQALLDAAALKIKDGEQELSDKKKELEDAKTSVADGKIELADAKTKLADGEQELSDKKAELEDAKKTVADGKIELADAQVKIADGEQELNDKKAELADAKKTVTDGEIELAAALTKLTDGERELESKQAELADAKEAVAENEGLLAEARTKISDGEQELSDKELELDKAKNELASFIEHESWTVQRRSDNPSYGYADFYAKSGRTLCFSMALLFVFVGLMVCYTSVSRNVNETQVITGVQKALGFRQSEIIKYYMLYSIVAVIIGIIFGCLMGYFIIEPIVNNAYLPIFSIGEIKSVFTVPEAVIISLVELVLISLATYIPCRKLLKRPAISLLRGDNPGCGRTRFYEKFKLWDKLSLYTQTTLNNLANDGARVTATLVGVAGCTALIVMSMALQFGISDTPTVHKNEVWTYDSCLVFDSAAENAETELCKVLDEFGAAHTSAQRETVFIEDKDGNLSKSDLIVPENPEQLRGFIKLNDYASKAQLDIPENGAIISRTYQRGHGVSVGDTIRLMDTDSVYHDCLVVGVSEHYLSTNQIVMSGEYYSQIMSKRAVNNTVYVNFAEGTDVSALTDTLKDKAGYFSLTDENAKWTAAFSAASQTTTLIVYIGLSLSAAMALLVLLNLNIVCVNKKAKELIIMRINGFSIGAAKKYIYRDNIVLTAIGMFVGIFAGMGLGVWILGALQSSGDNFYTNPSLAACLTAIGLTVLFSLITNLIALHKIDKMKVSDLNKL